MGRWLPIGRPSGLVSGEELFQTQSPEQSLSGCRRGRDRHPGRSYAHVIGERRTPGVEHQRYAKARSEGRQVGRDSEEISAEAEKLRIAFGPS